MAVFTYRLTLVLLFFSIGYLATKDQFIGLEMVVENNSNHVAPVADGVPQDKIVDEIERQSSLADQYSLYFNDIVKSGPNNVPLN